MSRIGKKPIEIQKGLNIEILNSVFTVSGPKGKMSITLPKEINVEQDENHLNIKTSNELGGDVHGLMRTLIQNAITGVSTGWQKTLELVGVGFRAQTTGSELVLNLGFSHPIKIIAPAGITFSIIENKITVSGFDKYIVGEVAAKIRRLKKPEPYKGKGIRYAGEIIRKKLGKAAKAVGGASGAK
jgi:large subunit ribosomal protein L6